MILKYHLLQLEAKTAALDREIAKALNGVAQREQLEEVSLNFISYCWAIVFFCSFNFGPGDFRFIERRCIGE